MNLRGALVVLVSSVGLIAAAARPAAGSDPPSGLRAMTRAQARRSSATPAAVARNAAPARVRAQRSPTGTTPPARPPAVHSVGAPAVRAPDLLSAAIVNDKDLANERGGTATSNTNNAMGTVSGNAASQLTTGSNAISQGSFANSSGIPIVIQNTGNNVLIQNSTILNLQLTNPQ